MSEKYLLAFHLLLYFGINLQLVKLLFSRSLGKLVEAVYPEALEYVPEKELQNLYKEPMVWTSDEIANGSIQTTAQTDSDYAAQLALFVEHKSDLSTGHRVDYESSSRVWLPHPWYRLPYMVVVSMIEREGDGFTSSAIDSGSNTNIVSAEGVYFNPPSGNYRTIGTHNGTHSLGYTPLTYAVGSFTPWYEVK